MARQLYFQSTWVVLLACSLTALPIGFWVSSNHDSRTPRLIGLAGPIVVVLFLKLTLNYKKHGLYRYPGPVLAKFTNFWHWLDVHGGRHQFTLLDLHRKNGAIVRIGPNTLSISDPAFISKVYGVNAGFTKSNMYDPFSPRIKGKPLPSLFTERNERIHSALRKPIASAYNITTVLDHEPLVDTMIEKLLSKLKPFAADSQPCDIGSWLRWFAFDMITNLTFGESLGFMDEGADVKGFISVLDTHMDDTAVMSTMPWTALLWKHNPIVGYFKQEYSVLTPFTRRKIQEHVAHQIAQAKGSPQPSRPVDFTDRFLEAAKSPEPPGINVTLVVNWTLNNFVAGGDTTTIALRSVLYNVVKNPRVYAKLMAELSAEPLSRPVVTYQEAMALPYLSACIREALRIHPSIGLGLERVVPASGLVLPDGYTLPGGTKVSMNAWIVARDRTIFGDDADVFRPERWLRGEGDEKEEFEARLAGMKRADLVFGAGSRSCIGKNVSFLEIYKAVPSLLMAFELEVAGGRKWEVQNKWIVRQSGFECVVKERGVSS